MALRLRIVSEHASRLGQLSTKLFGVHGGTIGRATDNEWILPDPERYLSGKHARVDFRAGNYVLVDTSSNGTYVNGAQVPLGKYHDYSLKDGDYVRLGEYELLVSIDKSNDFPPEESAIVAYDGQSPSSAVKKSTANDLGADLDLSELLEPSDLLAGDSGVRPRDAYGQAVGERSPAPSRQAPNNASLQEPTDEPSDFDAEPQADASATPWHMMTRPIQREGVPATPARAPNALLYDGDVDIGLSAFCRGAGIDPQTIGPEARAAALQLAGQLLRESVLGLMDLNQSGNEFKNRFRITTPANDAAESPLNFSRGVDEALVRLLSTISTRAGSVEAIRQNFRELKAHNTASLAATRAAFEEFLARVDPKELEERFERATKRGVFGSQNKAKYWDLYAELYAGIAQRPAEGFPHLFTEAFAKTFESKIRTLVPPRRTAFGSSRTDAEDSGDQAVGEP
jgi:type VI secretion system protein